jgi:tetraacyldisaccharide 4'-kinase
MQRPGARAPVPVICIGNFTLGGAGKTPTAIHVAGVLRSMGWSPAFLTRGYGGALAGPIRVDPARHGFREVGDEALLLARHAPTILSRRRPQGAALATSLGADVIVMDDGLQNPSLLKDLTIAVFDAAAGTGNGLVFPAGPLRAPLEAQWARIDAALVIGAGDRAHTIAEEAACRALPVLCGALRADRAIAASIRGRRVLAFAGIGRPEKFFATLREIGAEPVETRSFPDHHAYRERDMAELLDGAAARDLVPVTTEKDAVRLLQMVAAEPRVSGVLALPVELVLETDQIRSLLNRALQVR